MRRGRPRVPAALRRDDAGPAHRRAAAPPAARRAAARPPVRRASGRRPRASAAAAVWRRGWRGLLRYPRRPPGADGACWRSAAGVAVGRRARAARRRRSSASASPCTCSASTPSSRCRRRSTTPTTPTACPRPRGWLLAHHLAAPAVAAGAVRPHRRGRRSSSLEPDAWAAALALCVPVTLGRRRAARSSASCATPPTRWPRPSPRRRPCRRSSPASRRRSGCSGRSPSARSPGCSCWAARELPTTGTVVRMAIAAGARRRGDRAVGAPARRVAGQSGGSSWTPAARRRARRHDRRARP